MYFREYSPEELDGLSVKDLRKLPHARDIAKSKSKGKIIVEIIRRMAEGKIFVGDVKNPLVNPSVKVIDPDTEERYSLEFRGGSFKVPSAEAYRWLYDRLWALGYRLLPKEVADEKPDFLDDEDPEEAPPLVDEDDADDDEDDKE